ncbi:unnamed protein product [Litomosoides sigmodontis]|uniref:Uncharacterized protein n=1 Tax=Litomosoides sigmodontis TaxID=42156 RepID=A0A3P7JYG9_LITSI|nr:unnamed protein product [Litomosoides sigmodontis]
MGRAVGFDVDGPSFCVFGILRNIVVGKWRKCMDEEFLHRALPFCLINFAVFCRRSPPRRERERRRRSRTRSRSRSRSSSSRSR